MERGERESLVRISGQSISLEQVGNSVVAWREPRPVLVRDVAEVRLGGPVRRGDGSVWVKQTQGATEAPEVQGGDAVILAVQKQPHADTLKLDRELDRVLDEMRAELPVGVEIEGRVFKQADFIEAAVDNVVEAVRDGALWVVVVLFLFMWNFRVSVSSLTAMPLSILLTVLVFRWLGISINTMTMGGIAVAIGDLVDDSIVDIENIYRRLKENRHADSPRPALQVVFLASCEVRNSIVYATLIVTLVVLPRTGGPDVRAARRRLHRLAALLVGRIADGHAGPRFPAAAPGPVSRRERRPLGAADVEGHGGTRPAAHLAARPCRPRRDLRAGCRVTRRSFLDGGRVPAAFPRRHVDDQRAGGAGHES
jgi:hypothetical protein